MKFQIMHATITKCTSGRGRSSNAFLFYGSTLLVPAQQSVAFWAISRCIRGHTPICTYSAGSCSPFVVSLNCSIRTHALNKALLIGMTADLAQIVNDIQMIYGPVMFLTKLSLLLQMMNIFALRRTGTIYYLCQFMIWANFIFYTIIMFLAIFMCSPRRKFWDRLTPGHCMNNDTINIVTAIINAASDLVLLLLPIICVFKLQMSLKKKIGVSAVFATAALYVSDLQSHLYLREHTLIGIQCLCIQHHALSSSHASRRCERYHVGNSSRGTLGVSC